MVSSREVPAEFVADFVNTRADGAGHLELFGSAEDLRAWGVRRQVLAGTAPVTQSDLVAVRELREALRTLLLVHAQAPELPAAQREAAHDYLRQAAIRYPLVADITADRARLLGQASGVPGLLGHVLAAVVEAQQHGEWQLVKACCSPVCQFAFVDRTRNHSGRFCSPRCASRVSMHASRERRRQTAPVGPE